MKQSVIEKTISLISTSFMDFILPSGVRQLLGRADRNQSGSNTATESKYSLSKMHPAEKKLSRSHGVSPRP
jgi:hypothetical protein